MDQLTLDRGDGTSCSIAMYGATMVSWSVGGEEIIFVSPKAVMDGTKAIRGGIPICFPSFGPWSLGPQHGFARTSVWKREGEISTDEGGNPTASLILTDGEHSKAWPHLFYIALRVTLGVSSIILKLEVKNMNKDAPFDFTTALHTYFKVPEVTKASILGLSGLQYIDKTVEGHPTIKEDREKVALTGWTDRVYLDSGIRELVLERGPGAGAIKLTKTSSLADTVVWNPWPEKAGAMSDLGAESSDGFICVEAGQCVTPVQVAAGSSWSATHTMTYCPQ